MKIGHRLSVRELIQEGGPLPCVSSPGNMHSGWLQFFAILHVFISDHESTLYIVMSYA